MRKKKEIHIQWQSWRHCHIMCNVIKAKYVKVKLALYSACTYSQKSSHGHTAITKFIVKWCKDILE